MTIPEAGQVITRGHDHAVILPARQFAPQNFPEHGVAKYRKFAYSSAFGFSGDVADISGSVHTDSMLAFTDADGNRRMRVGVEAAGVEEAMAWSTWHPWPDVRVDTVCWAIDASWHGRIHRVRAGRAVSAIESGFALGFDIPGDLAAGAARDQDRTVLTTAYGCSAIVDIPVAAARRAVLRTLAVNATLVHPRTAVPALRAEQVGTDTTFACAVFASPSAQLGLDDAVDVTIPAPVTALLERIAAEASPR